jgi:hypothetical protein
MGPGQFDWRKRKCVTGSREKGGVSTTSLVWGATLGWNAIQGGPGQPS